MARAWQVLVLAAFSLALTAPAQAAPVPADATAWPGGAAVAAADQPTALGKDVSGLAYEGSGSATPGVLWAVDNGEGSLNRLIFSGGLWVRDTANNWGAGKLLHFPGGGGTPDAEGVTLTDAGSAGGVFVSSERDGANSGVSRPSVLRYDVTGNDVALTATREWDLTADLPGVGPNEGLESITWVPDTYLAAAGLRDQSKNAPYDPANYPDHGNGLFFVGLEANGTVYGYALNQSAPTFQKVAAFASGFPTIAELHWDRAAEQLWAVCDDNCNGRTGVFKVAAGAFTPVAYYERPAGMPNLNNEGFATTPASECANGSRPVFWADDGNTDGNALRAGTLNCGAAAATATTTAVSVTPTAINATVSAAAGTPSGTVAFSVDGVAVGTAPLNGGTATLAHVVPSGGERTVTASYSGDATFAASTGSVVRRDPGITGKATSTKGPSAAGWYGAPVTVTFTCTAAGATVSCPEPVVLNKSGIDQSASGTAGASDGGSATATVKDIDIDLDKPKVKLRRVKNGKVYRGRAPRPKCKATDALSGVARCKLKTKRRKTKRTVTATATDKAGNVAVAKVSFRVVPRRG
jgi:hypothetical protein